jgi:tyrosyl-tRNA synthetase
MPLLVGTDGTEKMSKSYNNYIGISEEPKEIYGKTLSIPDKLIYTYYELGTDVSTEKLIDIKTKLEDENLNPRDLKRELARTIVKIYYDEDSAANAEEAFDKVFIRKENPDEIPEYKIDEKEINIIDLILKVQFAQSKSEARRLVTQGGVTVDGEKIDDINSEVNLDKEKILKVGKRKFAKLISI